MLYEISGTGSFLWKISKLFIFVFPPRKIRGSSQKFSLSVIPRHGSRWLTRTLTHDPWESELLYQTGFEMKWSDSVNICNLTTGQWHAIISNLYFINRTEHGKFNISRHDRTFGLKKWTIGYPYSHCKHEREFAGIW